MSIDASSGAAPSVVVVGSANIDLVLGVERIPGPGETVLSRHTARHPGGKGLNQAVAASRAGATVALVACVGADEHGDLVLETLAAERVDARGTLRVGLPTGTATVLVDAVGENSIVVTSGANLAAATLDDRAAALVAAARVLVLQLEIPLDRVLAAALHARASGVRVLLNAAPAAQLPEELLDVVDLLVVNQHEATVISGWSDPEDAARALRHRVDEVVVTLGVEGALHVADDLVRLPGRPARVVDTTGAGDAFVGTLAAGLAGGLGTAEALERAGVAGALATETGGAVPSLPLRSAIDERMGSGAPG